MRTMYLKITFLIMTMITIAACTGKKPQSNVIFPRAFALAIDDMGWNEGSNLGENGGQGPYRAGVKQHMDLNNYKVIVEVGKAVGVRIQGLFILCEMDRTNVCAKYPTTTMYGADWDNSKNVCNEQIEIMNFVRDHSANLEFGLHGVGHEFWPEKMHKVRAEWYNLQDNKPWPEEILNDHIKCFKEIMAQYGLTPENGHSFPESFVPCAYSYYWNPTGEYSLGKVLGKNGIKYANTLFSYVEELNPPKEPNGGGFDHGVHVINRINYGNEWYHLSATPTVELDKQESDIIETHWPNWLAQDTFLQPRVTQQFIDYYNMVQANPNRYVAKNTEQLHSQWLYNKYAKVNVGEENKVIIDNTAMPEEAYVNNLLGNMVLKIKIDSGSHISSAKINDMPVSCYFEDAGYAFIYLPVLEKKTYELQYSIGKEILPNTIFNDGTYNVYKVAAMDKTLSFDIKMYGTQLVKIKCENPIAIESNNANLQVLSSQYNGREGMLLLEVSGRDFQGEKGTLTLKF